MRGIGSNHQGWDLYADENTPIFAIAGGTIATVVDREPFTTGHGRYLTLAFQFADPDDREMKTFYALYSHLKAIHVQVGAVVAEGYPLGLTGTSGNARGGPPHLHFGILRSAHPQKGLEGNIDPGHVLGFHTLNFDTLFPNWNRA